MATVFVRVRAVRDLENGVVALDLPSRELTKEETKVIETLLPDLQEGFYKLLHQQALLSCLAKDSEIHAPPEKQKLKNKYPLSEDEG